MAVLTFQDIQLGLGPNASTAGFTCIGFLSDQPRTRCSISAGLKLERARQLICKGIKKCAQLRELISCLLCEKDNKSATFRDSLLRQWCCECAIPYIKRGRPRKVSGSASGATNGSRTGSRSTPTSQWFGSPSDAGVQPDTPCPKRSEPIEDPKVDKGDHEQIDEQVNSEKSTKLANESFRNRIRAAQIEADNASPVTSAKYVDAARQAPSLSADEDSTPSYDSEDAIREESSSRSAPSEEEDDDFRHDFLPGEACDWSPDKVRHSLLESFFRPLNTSPPPKGSTGGYVYAAPILGYRQAVVKIGHTANAKPVHTVKARLQGVKRGHGVEIDFKNAVSYFHSSKAVLRRLEKIVHDELAEYQLDLRHRSTTPKEYYAVDIETAGTTIFRWKKRMEQLGFREGFTLDSRLQPMIMSKHEAFLPASRDAKTAWFRQRAAGRPSHEDRQRVWEEIFQDNDGEIKAIVFPPPWFRSSIYVAALVTCFALYLNSSRLALVLLFTSHYLRTDWSSWHSIFLLVKKNLPFLFDRTGGIKAKSP